MSKLNYKRCKYCRGSFKPKCVTQVYCDVSCGNKYRYEEEYRAGHIERLVYANCLICGKEFQKNSLRHVFCGETCRRESRKTSGANPDMREYVLEKYNFTCQKCNTFFSELESLHAHHIIPLFKGGEDNEENIIALCIECHREEHRFLGEVAE